MSEQEKNENIILETGREVAAHWQKGAIKSGSPEQISNQLNVLYYAAVNILATMSINMTRKDCVENPVSEGQAILEIREDIEKEVDFLKSKMDDLKFTSFENKDD